MFVESVERAQSKRVSKVDYNNLMAKVMHKVMEGDNLVKYHPIHKIVVSLDKAFPPIELLMPKLLYR